MEMQEYDHMYESEGSHFYYVATHELFLELIRTYLAAAGHYKILDAGCGTGLLAKKLEKFGRVIGVDIHPRAIYFAKKRKVKVVQGSLNSLPFKKGEFDLVVSVDVLYHRQVEDKKALREIYRVLARSGLFIMRVPAFNWLTRSSDIQVHTRERYDRAILETRLLEAGFDIERITYVHTLFFLFAAVSKLAERVRNIRGPASDVKSVPQVLNTGILFLLRLEMKILRYVNLPFGLGLVAVARKR